MVSLVEPGAFSTGVLKAGSRTKPTIGDYDGPRDNAHRTLHNALHHGGDPRPAAAVIGKIAAASRPRARLRRRPRQHLGPPENTALTATPRPSPASQLSVGRPVMAWTEKIAQHA